MRSSSQLLIFSILHLSQGSLAGRQNGFVHDAVDANREARDVPIEPLAINFTVTETCPTPTPTHPPILSFVYPSPDASPVEVTEQSQVVTSYIPEMTWCVGPPVGLVPLIANLTGPPYLNHSMEDSTTIAGTGSCETMYSPTTTTICATTLTGLASKVYITECDQEVTFSSECGFTLETPTPTAANLSLITPAPTVKRMMTYWMAPWQSLTRGQTPSDVDIKICTELENGEEECMRFQEVWEVVVITKTSTTTRSVNLATTLSGPGTLIVETMQVFITDTIETVDLSTALLLQTEIEIETTSRGMKPVTSSADGVAPAVSSVYITKKVKYKTPKPEPTTTVYVTHRSTMTIVGTITKTRPRPRPTLLDFVAPEIQV